MRQILKAAAIVVALLTTTAAGAWHVKCIRPTAAACVSCLSAAHPEMRASSVQARCEELARQIKNKKKS